MDQPATGFGRDPASGLLRQVVDSMSDAVAFYDLEGRFLGCNKAYERLMGRSASEFRGRTAYEFFDRSMAEEFSRVDAEVCRRRVPSSVEVPFRRKDGSPARIECARYPLTDGKDDLIGILIVLRDVTAQKTVEDSLKTSEEKYRLLAEYSSDAIWVLDLETERFTYLSPSVEKLWGYAPDEALGMPLCAFMTPESYQAVKNRIALTLPDFIAGREEARHIYQIKQIRKDGSAIWVESHARYRYGDRHRIEVVGNSRNIEERVLAQASLRESEDMYRMIAENTSDGIWVYNLDQDRFTYLNPAIARMLEFPIERIARMKLMEGLSPEFRDRAAKRIAEALETLRERPDEPISEIFEFRQPTGSGQEIWVEVSARIRRNVKGETEILAVSRNIESRKKAEREVLSLSYQDSLTGLRNRRSMEEELRRQDGAENLPISILVGDVDGLKHVNDTLGHEMGDEMLVLASQAIRSSCRPDDHVFRWGGDEFVIILPHTTRNAAEKVVDRISATCGGLRVGPLRLSISLGVATKTMLEEKLPDVLRAADEAMYRVKGGRAHP